MEELKQDILRRLKAQQGHVGFYFKNLVTGENFGYREKDTYLAASVIKLPMYMAIARWAAEGKVDLAETLQVKEADKVPICGALTLFSGEPTVDIRTLCNLMISLSDNTATNVLMDRFGIPAFQEEFSRMGLVGTQLNRKLFDRQGAAKELSNYIVPLEIAMLLEQIYRRRFVDEATSAMIEHTLRLQQIQHKIRGILGEEVKAAHKTGEDDHISHDMGIVFARQPFIVCFAGNDTDNGEFNDLIRHVSAEIYGFCNRT